MASEIYKRVVAYVLEHPNATETEIAAALEMNLHSAAGARTKARNSGDLPRPAKPDPAMRLSERFFKRVDVNGPVPTHRPELGPCHIWLGPRGKRHNRTYGMFSTWTINKASTAAHRMAFFLANDRWPEPCCCHHCDNPPCVNPAHLFEGTYADNTIDMVSKGRHWTVASPEATKIHAKMHGENQHLAKMTDDLVVEILEASVSGEQAVSLGNRLGVHPQTIRAILKGKTWRHIVLPWREKTGTRYRSRSRSTH